MFVERVRQLLKEKGIFAKDMLSELGINKNQLTRWEKEGTLPNRAILIAIADFLDTTPEYLTGETDEKRKTAGKPDGISNDDVNALDDALDGLTADELQQVRKYAEFLKQQRN